MVSGRIMITAISREDAIKFRRTARRVNSYVKCGITAGIISSTISGAIHYFGGSEYSHLANSIFESGGLTALISAGFAMAYHTSGHGYWRKN